MGAAGVLPGNPDLEAMGAETFSPGVDPLGLGRQEGRVLGHRVGRRAQDAGHAHHRSPADIARPLERRDVGHDAFHPGYRPQQRLQSRPGPQRDPISQFREMRAEAGEEKVISKALFSSEHQQFVLQSFAAPSRPCGGRKALRNADLERDAPLVPRPCLAPAAVEQFDQRDRIERLIVIGGEGQAAAHVIQGFRKAAEQIERLGAVGME